MSQDKAKLIEILRELIVKLNENHVDTSCGWLNHDMFHPMYLDDTVEEFIPLLTSLGISVEDLGLLG